VYSAISCEEILSLPIFRACVSTCRYLLKRAATPTVNRSATTPLSHQRPCDKSSRFCQRAPLPRRRNRNPRPERVRVDEVREHGLAVDLDHGDPLPVARLELRVSVDLDDLELETLLGLRLAYDLERPLAEMALRPAVERDAGYG
jgi:hypothetical protein